MSGPAPDAALPEAARRVALAARELDLNVNVILMPASTRTAVDAAAACGCSVARIVKSLVFRDAAGEPLLLLVSGANRVDEAAVAARLGRPIERPDAGFVRAVTGFAIGGIPPFGHAKRIATFVDRDLLDHATVWAAAGTPNTVMELDPRALADAVAATVLRVDDATTDG